MSHELVGKSPAAPDAREAAGGSTVDQLLTVLEVAGVLNVGERFVRRLVAERRITVVHVGRHIRIPMSAVSAFINAGIVPPLGMPSTSTGAERWAA